MSTIPNDDSPLGAPRFQAGGALEQGSLYVKRPADDALFNALSAGDYCHVLAPRQIGKTSLCVRVAARLMDAGAQVAFVDLSALGSTSSFEDWLHAIASEIARPLGAASDMQALWEREAKAPPAQRFGKVMSEVVAPRARPQIVVFIDEIDAVLVRNGTDAARRAEATDFFWAIRSLHNLRAREGTQARLVFCLAGVASPSDLMQESGKSPFVVSRRIELRDFTRDELSAFEPHVCPDASDPKALLDEVWAWTSGHPYMVQHLCEEISGGLCVAAARPRDVVRSAVDRRFLGPRRHDDVVLSFANNYLSRQNREMPLARMLHLHRRLLEQGSVQFDPRNDAHLRLMLAGLATTRDEGAEVFLVIRNRILREVFDEAWVEERELELHLGEPLLRWLHAPDDKKASFLLRGPVLREVLEWQKTRADIRPQERDFIEASLQVELRERERELEIERQRKEREQAEAKTREADARARRTRRVNMAIAALLAVTAVVSGSLWIAYRREQNLSALVQEKSDALQQKSREAEEQSRRFAEALQLGQDALVVARTPGFEPGTGGPPASEGLLSRALQHIGHYAPRFDDVSPPALQALVTLLNEAPLAHAAGRLRAKVGAAQTVAFSPDGRRLLVGDDGGASLWDMATGARLHDLVPSPPDSIRAAAFSPDGKVVITGGKSGALDRWDTSSGQSLGALRGHAARLSSIRVLPSSSILTSGDDGSVKLHDPGGGHRELLPPSPISADTAAVSSDGSLLAAGTGDGLIHLWDAAGRPAGELRGHAKAVYDLAFSASGKLLLSGGADGMALVWDVVKKERSCAAAGHTKAISAVAFSPDGELFVTGAYDGTVRAWDRRTCRSRWTSDAASTPVVDVVFLADGARVASASIEGFVRILDAQDGRLSSTLLGHTAPIRDMVASPDGEQIAAASMDESAIVWSVPRGRPLVEMRAPVEGPPTEEEGQPPPKTARRARDISYSNDGARLFAGYETGFVRVWSADTGALLHADRAHSGAVRRLVTSPAAERFVTAGADGKVLLWSGVAPFSTRELPMSGGGAQNPGKATRCEPTGQPPHGLHAAEIDPSGALIAAAGGDCAIRVWDAATGELRTAMFGHEAEVLALSFSPGGKLLASEDAQGVLHVWDTTTGSLTRSMKTAANPPGEEPDPVAVLRFLSENRLLAGIKYETARIWDVRSGEPITELKASGHWLVSAEASRVPGLVVTSSWDQSAKIWDAASGQLLRSLWGHDGPVRKSSFSPDGAWVWTVSADEHLRAWDARGGPLLAEIHAGSGDLWDIEPSPDGRHVAVADARGTVRVFPATIEGFFMQGCELLRRRKSYAEVKDVCGAYESRIP